MSMGIGTRTSNIKRYTFRKPDGSVVASMSIHKSTPKKKKRLQYNFKQVSKQILQTKTPINARQVVTRARSQVVNLRRKLYSDDYDYSEIRHALIHAEKMVRIAKKRMKHLQEEENIQKKGGVCEGDLEEESQDYDELLGTEDAQEISEEKMQEIMEDLQEQIRELEEAISDGTGLEELAEEMMPLADREMDPADLELLKKKHRAEEMREIMEADMKYLKALFDKFERERQESANGSNSTSDSNANSSGVSLELGGVDIPVEATEGLVLPEGGTLDILA
ncbi:MAG: hypothetical protein NC429_02345 [Lachnospiraceae bacterium]|nr:hypothetical protein [Lachnospiraceae bacterium]